MNQRTIDQLEYEYEQLKKVDLDSISEDDALLVVVGSTGKNRLIREIIEKKISLFKNEK